MPIARLIKFLDSNEVRYTVINHSPAYTAQEVAESAHVSGNAMAKTVMIMVDGDMAMAVVRASDVVHMERLARAIGAKQVDLSTEKDFKYLFPDCDIGSMPPFGNLYDLPVYVSRRLAEDAQIAFNAGRYTQVIQLPYGDFERLVEPKVLDF